MSEGWIVVIGLGVLAGGGIIVIDALVIRQIRRLGPPGEEDRVDRQERPDDRAAARP